MFSEQCLASGISSNLKRGKQWHINLHFLSFSLRAAFEDKVQLMNQGNAVKECQ
jgi:hypothetical protein